MHTYTYIELKSTVATSSDEDLWIIAIVITDYVYILNCFS